MASVPRPTPEAQVLGQANNIGASSVKRKRFEPCQTTSISDWGTSSVRKLQFDASTHLTHIPPSKVWTMEEISKAGQGVSPTAVSEPFQLFSEEAVRQMRAEVLSRNVLENCKYKSNLAQCQLRGMAPQYAPFVYDVWRSDAVMNIISKIAGVELVPQMDFEIAHINIAIRNESEEAIAAALKEKEHRDADEGVSGCPWEDDEPIVDWHTDSYPFVCVTMLSDCSSMIGGETALRRGDGEIMKGHAVVLQGRYIEHQALRTFGGKERITMVTSFRPKSAFVRDDTVLTTVRSISNLGELYSQYTEYRFEMLEERLRAQLKEIRERKRARRGFNTSGVKAFMLEQKSFLEVMLKEMVDDDKVVEGFTEDSHLLSEDLKLRSKKKARLMSEEL